MIWGAGITGYTAHAARREPVLWRQRVAAAFCVLAVCLSLPVLTSQVHALPLSTQTQPSAFSAKSVAEPKFPDTVRFTLNTEGAEAEGAVLNYRLVGQPVTVEVRPDKVASGSAGSQAQLTLDLSTHYIPPGAEVLYYWSLTDAAGIAVDTPAQTFTMLDERHEWLSLTDAQGRVSVHWYEGSDTFGRQLLDTARNALDLMAKNVGTGLERPANIWVYSRQDELLDALPKNLPEWVGGKAFPELSLVLIAVADDEEAELEIKRVVPHELSHLVLYGATRNPYNAPPGWLDEGLAVYHQEAQDPTEEDILRQAAESGEIPPLKALSGTFGAGEEDALLSYAQSHSVVAFILEDPRYGPDKLARTIASFREGVTYDEASRAGLGISVDELDKQWRESLPYEIAAPGSTATGQPGRDASPLDFSLRNPIVLVPVAIATTLFLAGGLLTVVLLMRRRLSKL